MDRITPQCRSWNMSRIRSHDTIPEKRVRSLLHRHGFRFSLRRKDLPGKPDIVLPSRRAVVFVHGCFWHQHAGCQGASMPKTRRPFWEAKLKGNVASHNGLGMRAFERVECLKSACANPQQGPSRVMSPIPIVDLFAGPEGSAKGLRPV
jgi:DNA mismatch endonuclease Vsr